MTHSIFTLDNVGLKFPHKVCFSDFSAFVHHKARIGIIGRNGSGKSALLQIIQGLTKPSEGKVCVSENVTFGYVPQIIDDFPHLSGGQRLNQALTQALLPDPDVLIMDEPTNHLDSANRKQLIRLLQKFTGTLIIASHDENLLRTCMTTFWGINNERVSVFNGHYDDYQDEIFHQQITLEKKLNTLKIDKKNTHKALMKEQHRAAKSRKRGEEKRSQNVWPTLVAGAKKRQGQVTAARKKKHIEDKKQDVVQKLHDLRPPEVIIPHFSLNSSQTNSSRVIVSIVEGSCGYDEPVLENIFLSLSSTERLALTGINGSGKSTLVKAILNYPTIHKSGTWTLPAIENIGYLDQHYATLDSAQTVFDTLYTVVPHWLSADIRRHLNDFLFRKNEEVQAFVSTLSGGEKARLCLAQIAACPPVLLILDEITNNLDKETCRHVCQILKPYPGAMIVISHDDAFLKEIGVDKYYNLSVQH